MSWLSDWQITQPICPLVFLTSKMILESTYYGCCEDYWIFTHSEYSVLLNHILFFKVEPNGSLSFCLFACLFQKTVQTSAHSPSLSQILFQINSLFEREEFYQF